MTSASLAFTIATTLSSSVACGATDISLLERTGERVKMFWDQLASVASTESILQEKLNPKGKVVLNNRTKFDYLITLRWDQQGMLVDESRLAVGQAQKKAPQGTLLTSQGFATLLMIFHPQFQSSYAFTSSGATDPAGKQVLIDFSAKNGAPTPAVLALKGRDYPIGWEGTAWIDPGLAMVTKIEAHWKTPPEEIGLQDVSTEVIYARTQFQGSTKALWLPTMAKVEVKTLHQHWRNTHEFLGYRLFSVEADSTVAQGEGVVDNRAEPKSVPSPARVPEPTKEKRKP